MKFHMWIAKWFVSTETRPISYYWTDSLEYVLCPRTFRTTHVIHTLAIPLTRRRHGLYIWHSYLTSVIYCAFNIDTTFQLFSDHGRWGSPAAPGSLLVRGSTGFGLAWVTGDPGRMVGLVAGSGCSHSDERRLVPWVVNLLSRVPGRSACRVCGRTCDGLRVACVSPRALSYHSGLAGVCAFPVFRSISSAPEWHAVGNGVALHPGIGHFSIYWPRAVWCRDGGSAGSGHVIFAQLVGWGTWCVAALVRSDIIPSVSVCVWGCGAGVPTVLLSINAMQVDMRT